MARRWQPDTVISIYRTALWFTDKALAQALLDQLEIAREDDFEGHDLEELVEKITKVLQPVPA